MHIRRLTLAIAVITVVCAGACSAYVAGSPEFRAIYVNAWADGLKTAGQINQLISDAHYCNANTIVAEVRRRGDTIYPSVEPTCSGFSSGFDSLADLIQKCHTTSPRLDVQAWFVVWPIESDPATTDPNHPYNRYRQYLTKTNTGATSIAGDYWFDPGNPGAEQYTYNVIMDVVNRYDVDGINFDYIRLGSGGSGYNDVSVTRFNSFSARYSGDFSLWRRDQITSFVRKVYANAIAVKPNIKVTADCISQGGAPADLSGFQSSAAYANCYQNWPAWMQEGILDMDIPMAYFDCATYPGYFDAWTCFVRNYAYNRQCAPAADVFAGEEGCLTSQLNVTRNSACGATNGAAIYCYSKMTSSIMNAARAAWTTPAAVPTMPWKSAPTKGHIKGNVTFAGSIWIDGASISLTGPTSRSMYADGTGFFAFIDLPPGSYTLTCTAPAYGVLTKPCVVTAGHVTSVDCDYPLSTLIISNVQAGAETQSGATITWTTNAGASSRVYYGLDRTCSSSTVEYDTSPTVTSHSVPLTGLLPGTTYYYRVYSVYPGVPSALSSVCALVTKPSSPADIIIEAWGDHGQGQNPACYSEVNAFGYGSSKSTASGCTPGIGTRYGSINTYSDKEAHYKPAIVTAGSYGVWVTWCTSSYGGSNIKHTVTYNGGQYTTSYNQSVNSNVWNYIGAFPFVAGASGSCGEVKQWVDALETNKRINADAVKFTWAGGESVAPSTPTNLAATNIQDDSITLGWTASTDNVAVAGYRISRGPDSTVYVVDSSPTNSYSDIDILPNTHYWYAVSAYDTSGNKSGTSTTINLWSMCPKPTTTSVTCDKQSGVWQTAGPFTFTAVGGFGPGKINYYRYAWDTSPSHTWLGTESAWVGGTNACTATSSASPYYLHIRGYNQAATPGEPSDLGPYYLDTTGPGTPIVADDGGYTPSQTSVHATWSSDEPESGLIGYQYAVGTTSGGTNLVSWTTTTDTSATIPIASQAYGTTLYVSVKAQNGAQVWSGVGVSDGIKVARSVASAAEAKSLANGTILYLANETVSAVFSTCFYVQDAGASGIRVEGSCPYAVGTRVNVGGVLGINAANERNITSASVTLAP